MAMIAIQVGIAVGVSLASSALSPKQKLQPVDRGKLDDLRFTFMEEGAFKPLVYGQRVRLAGIMRWATVTQEYVTRTPGRSGGKGGGGGRQAEPPTNNYTYRKSFAILFTGNRIKRFRRLWEDTEVIYNADGSDSFADFSEAELASLSGTATVVLSTQYSGGRAVALGTNGSITINNLVVEATGAHKLTIFYTAPSTLNVTVTVNGTPQTVSLPSASSVSSVEVTTALLRGTDNTVVIAYSGASGPVIDRVHARLTGRPVPDPDPIIVGVIDEANPYPVDLNNPRPFYNLHPTYNARGEASGTLTGGGQSAFEFYTGTEDQLQSPTIVAVEGADKTPAWRGDSMAVFNDYLVKEGRLGNIVAEVEPDIQDLALILADLYKQDKRVTDAEIDFSALAGTIVPGFVVHSREQLSTWVDSLQLWYNFDIVPVDGKVRAVKRGASTTFTLTEDDLMAYHDGQERPRGPVRQVHEDVIDVPGAVDVLYIEPSAEKEFHTGAQNAQAHVGDSYDRDTLNFPIVGDPDTAHAVGRRYLDQKELEAKPVEFTTGPAWRHLVPSDVGDIVLPNKTLNVRIVSAQAELQGLVKFRAVPERSSLYTQKGAGQLALGREAPKVEFPANTILVIADAPPVRAEDINDLMVYVGGCRRGAGAYKGFVLHKRNRLGEYERLAAFEKEAVIGVVETAANWAGDSSTVDRTSQLRVKLYHGTLESRAEDQLLTEAVNLALYGKDDRFEIIQFANAQPETPSAPFVAQYLITVLHRGRVATEYAMNAHQAHDLFMLLDGDAARKWRIDPQELHQTQTFKGVTFGQSLEDAPATEVVVRGNSQKLPAPTEMIGTRDGANNLRVRWNRRVRGPHNLRTYTPAPLYNEGEEEYLFEARDGSTVKHSRRVRGGLLGKVSLVDRSSTNEFGTVITPVSITQERVGVEDSFFEARIDISDPAFAPNLGLMDELGAYFATDVGGGRTYISPWILSVGIDNTYGVNVYENGVLKYTQNVAYSGTQPRLRVAIRQGTLRVYLDYESERTLPLYEDGRSDLSARDLRGRLFRPNFASNVALYGHAREYYYSAAQQSADGFTPGNPIRIRIYPISVVTGLGHHLEKDI